MKVLHSPAGHLHALLPHGRRTGQDVTDTRFMPSSANLSHDATRVTYLTLVIYNGCYRLPRQRGRVSPAEVWLPQSAERMADIEAGQGERGDIEE